MTSAPDVPQAKKKHRFLCWLIIAFATFHAASMVTALLPAKSSIRTFFRPYQLLTGTEQHWIMFQTIPNIQEANVRLEVRDASGESKELGPFLPGFHPFNMRSRVRHFYLMNRLSSAPGEPYFDAYIRNLASTIARTVPGTPVEFLLHYDANYIRKLENIRDDGEMTLSRTETRGPFPIDGK